MAKDDRLWIDMCAGSELKDTQGETLSVDGADITDLQTGSGRFNDNHGKGFFNSLGIVTEAKKIFKADDCENERHSYYWDKIKAPFVYAKGYLHNDEDHPNARAAAAIIRNIHRNDVPLKMKASVEGGVLARGVKDPTRLARTKIHSVALTFTPANNATLVEPLGVNKSDANWEKDEKLIKSVMHLAETNVPSFRHIERHASANTIYENIQKIQDLAKSLGIELEVKHMEPEIIMKNAVYSKISANINKINSLVKALSNPTPTDTYQQGVSTLKTTPTTPKPLDLDQDKNMKVKSALDTQKANQFKIHASRAMRDPAHINTIVNSLKDRGIHDSKINNIISRVKSHMSDGIKTKLKKALTAGYGGAGAPTANTGGGVLQPESLEGSKKTKKSETSDGFTYISCDNCGHEQVHMEHQVKCRKCKKNFPLSKLESNI